MIETAKYDRMIEAFTESHGAEVAMTLANSLRTDHLATKADLEPLATKADLKSSETRIDARIDNLETRIDACATKVDLKHLETRIDGRFAVVETRIDGCATKAGLAVLETRIDGCATTADLKGEMNRQLRWMITTMLASWGGSVAVMAMVVRSVT